MEGMDVMKYGNEHFYEAPRIFWPTQYKKKYNADERCATYTTDDNDAYKDYHGLSVNAKWLYQTLKELEHRYTGSHNNAVFEDVDDDTGWFYAGIDYLSYMSGLSESSVRRAKSELARVGLIRNCRVRLIDSNGNPTKVWVTGYYLPSERWIP